MIVSVLLGLHVLWFVACVRCNHANRAERNPDGHIIASISTRTLYDQAAYFSFTRDRSFETTSIIEPIVLDVNHKNPRVTLIADFSIEQGHHPADRAHHCRHL